VSKYGEQQQVDPWNSDCGNGVGTDGTLITGNDPLDSSSAIDESFVQAWIDHLTTRYGRASVSFYSLDNEPMLWNSTHRDVHLPFGDGRLIFILPSIGSQAGHGGAIGKIVMRMAGCPLLS
jgi:hypothetical protein